MNTKTVRGKKYLYMGDTTKPLIQRIEEAAKIKFAAIPVEKFFSIVVPDRLTTEKPGNENR
jgi:hypothetical protein